MPPTANPSATSPGAVRLFQLAGINVFLHWTWGLVAVYSIQSRTTLYKSIGWNIAEYLTLFLIVLLHEFGHALACRSVGGRAEKILLWPFGGIAYVDPPRRPGAVLWSIAAGPLVNVILAPIIFGILFFAANFLPGASDDLLEFIQTALIMNIALLVFNMLPIYPLDGGQIVQSILWFFVGQARSLKIATGIGMVGAAAGFLFALSRGDLWLMLLAGLAVSRCRIGLQQAKALSQLLTQPRYGGMVCPSCREAPVIGGVTARCACGQQFDPFSNLGRCPSCNGVVAVLPCALCRKSSAVQNWATAAAGR